MECGVCVLGVHMHVQKALVKHGVVRARVIMYMCELKTVWDGEKIDVCVWVLSV